MKNYDDIINLPHPELKHPRMSMYSRAAQFSPFAALTGYDDEIKETARLTNNKLIIDDDLKNNLDIKLQYIESVIKEKPLITINYFIKDNKKNGGSYHEFSGNIRRIDNIKKELIFVDNKKISINDIIDIEY